MEKLFRKLHEDRCPPGLERTIWRKLPAALSGSILIPVSLSVTARLLPPEGTVDAVVKATRTVDFFALALGLTSLIAVFTVAIGCIIVMIMKGPAYVADGYYLDASDTPAPQEKRK
jgi:hypothetical protein